MFTDYELVFYKQSCEQVRLRMSGEPDSAMGVWRALLNDGEYIGGVFLVYEYRRGLVVSRQVLAHSAGLAPLMIQMASYSLMRDTVILVRNERAGTGEVYVYNAGKPLERVGECVTYEAAAETAHNWKRKGFDRLTFDIKATPGLNFFDPENTARGCRAAPVA